MILEWRTTNRAGASNHELESPLEQYVGGLDERTNRDWQWYYGVNGGMMDVSKDKIRKQGKQTILGN